MSKYPFTLDWWISYREPIVDFPHIPRTHYPILNVFHIPSSFHHVFHTPFTIIFSIRVYRYMRILSCIWVKYNYFLVYDFITWSFLFNWSSEEFLVDSYLYSSYHSLVRSNPDHLNLSKMLKSNKRLPFTLSRRNPLSRRGCHGLHYNTNRLDAINHDSR